MGDTMSKDLSFNIKETFTGIYKAIAEKANLNGDDKLEGDEEISLFFDTKKTIDRKTNSVFLFEGKMFDKNGKEIQKTPIIAENDAIQVPKVTELNINSMFLENKNYNAVETIEDYVKNMSPEQIKKLNIIRENRKTTYNYAINHIYNDKLSQQEKEQLAKKMTSLVMDKCKKYDAVELAPVIIQILCVECGFDFSPKTLSKNSGNPKSSSSYVGSGQCNYVALGVCVNASDATTAEKTMHENYLSGYEEQVDDLKANYGQTKKELWEKAKTDGSLGVELAILTILNNLSYVNKSHSVKKALQNYGGAYKNGNSRLDWSIIPDTFVPKPAVKKKK